MIKNFLITVTRQLWRNRLFTFLNVLGLSVCISVGWIIFRMVNYENSYDKKISDAQNIYQIVSKSKDGDGKSGGFAGVAKPVLGVLKNDIPGVELAVPMFYQYHHHANVSGNKDEMIRGKRNGEEGDIQLISTFSEHFKMFPYKFIAGSSTDPLSSSDKVVLTDTRAKEYFPSLSVHDVVGKVITYDDSIKRQVSAVVASFDFPNSFEDNNEFIKVNDEYLDAGRWGGMSSNDLMFVKPSTGVKMSSILGPLNEVNRKFNKEQYEKYKYESWYEAFPLTQKHFESGFNAQTRTVDPKLLRGLMITAAFLLLLACINYINLSTAQLPMRAKEIGVRKTLGSSKGQIILSFMLESLVLCTFSALVSFGFTYFGVRLFQDFLPEGMNSYMNYGSMIAFMLGLILVISLVSGLYPAWISSRVNTVNVLKGVTEKVVGRNRFSMRKGLIIFQFLVAQVFIIGSVVIYRQIQFSLDKNPGFTADRIVTVDIPDHIAGDKATRDKILVFKNELERNSSLDGVSIGSRPMDDTMWGNVLVHMDDTTEVQSMVHMKFGDTDYLKLYDFKMLAGRGFMASDTMNEIVINEKALEAYKLGSPQEAVGKVLLSKHGNIKSYPIVGVVSDFHQFGTQSAINPSIIATKRIPQPIVNIKLPENVSQWEGALKNIEADWKKTYGSAPFKYTFYDDTVEKFYKNERRTQKLVTAATFIAILISCLGLFGLATLIAYRRTKEIGVRKVLGASVFSITRLLSFEFLVLVLISVLIASPIAWWMMNKWLQDFVFRIEIEWWMFFVAAVGAAAIALLTVSYQAIKAAVANPVKSLRTE